MTTIQEVKIYNNTGAIVELQFPNIEITNDPYDSNLPLANQQEGYSYDQSDEVWEIGQLRTSPELINEVESGSLFIALFDDSGNPVGQPGMETEVAKQLFFYHNLSALVFDNDALIKAHITAITALQAKNTEQDDRLSIIETDISTIQNVDAQQNTIIADVNTKATNNETAIAATNVTVADMQTALVALQAVVDDLTTPPVILLKDVIFTGTNTFNQQVNDMEGYFFMEDSNTLTLSENSITFTEERTVSIDFEWVKNSGFEYTYSLQKNGVTFFTDTTLGGVVETIDEVTFAQGDVFSVVVEPTQFFTMLTQAQFTFTDKP